MFEKIAKLVRNLGSSSAAAHAAASADPVAYKGYLIRPAPRHEGSHWHIAGTIVAEADPDGPVHEFIRADTFTARDEAIAFSVRKAQQIIDERGKKLFD